MQCYSWDDAARARRWHAPLFKQSVVQCAVYICICPKNLKLTRIVHWEFRTSGTSTDTLHGRSRWVLSDAFFHCNSERRGWGVLGFHAVIRSHVEARSVVCSRRVILNLDNTYNQQSPGQNHRHKCVLNFHAAFKSFWTSLKLAYLVIFWKHCLCLKDPWL